MMMAISCVMMMLAAPIFCLFMYQFTRFLCDMLYACCATMVAAVVHHVQACSCKQEKRAEKICNQMFHDAKLLHFFQLAKPDTYFS